MSHITSLSLELEADTPLGVSSAASLAPFLQGVLMGLAVDEYAQWLHQLPFNPYSQFCSNGKKPGAYLWRVNALTDHAAEQLLQPLAKMESIKLKRFDASLSVRKVTSEAVSLKSLTDMIYQGEEEAKVKVQFLTPTAFKSKGEYVIMPSLRLIIQNLLMRYNQVYDGSKEVDEDTLSYVSQHMRIVSYNLHSQYFENVAGGGKRIPAFVGAATAHVKGAPTMVGLVRMLLTFGEYSGVGIKTSMGMGGMKCL